MTEGLTEQEVAEMKESFSFFDVDKDGVISLKELGPLIRSLGQNPTDTELARMMQQLDQNSNGTLEFNEFVELMRNNVKTVDTMRDELREAFSLFDKDGNGFVSAEELQSVLTSVGDKLTMAEVKEMIRMVDSDNDGLLNYEEFVKMMTSQ